MNNFYLKSTKNHSIMLGFGAGVRKTYEYNLCIKIRSIGYIFVCGLAFGALLL